MTIVRTLVSGLIVSIAIGAPVAGSASGVTPSHVFQVVDNINGELALMHEANNSKSRTDKNAPGLTNRRPRHVYHKAREVFFKVQALRKINGQAANDLPPFPVREVLPADVKKLVERVLGDLRTLRGKFGVSKPSPTASLSSGKTPTDVYGNLVDAGLQLDGLGISRAVPNDVYQVALTLIDDLRKIRSARGKSGKIALQTGAKQKEPKHVYQRGFDVLSGLKKLSDGNSEFTVPGGVVLPNKRSGRIRPSHVLDVLNNALAEIGAIKVKIGITSPTTMAAPPSGKTPSNVFDAVSTALALVDSLN